MSEFVEFLPNFDEPITLREVKDQCRIDGDFSEDDDLISQVIIPNVRQMAETRTGSIIRGARYVQRMQAFPKVGGFIALTHGAVVAVESITYATTGGTRATMANSAFEAAVIERETLICPVADAWPDTGKGLRAVEITYTAGVSLDDMAIRFPTVRYWLLLAAAWGYDNREMFIKAKGANAFNELPAEYMNTLLDPLTLRTRF
jgi:uncharacterized phiE125 gp8 family phage protein